MSIWTNKPFDNDDADEWLNDFIEDVASGNKSMVSARLMYAFIGVLEVDCDSVIEVDVASVAIAGAYILGYELGVAPNELVAKELENVSMELDDIFESISPEFKRDLSKWAISAIRRIMNVERSEFAQILRTDVETMQDNPNSPIYLEWSEDLQNLEASLVDSLF